MWPVINVGLMVLCIDLDKTVQIQISTCPSPALLFIFWALIPYFFKCPYFSNFLTIQVFNICVSFVVFFLQDQLRSIEISEDDDVDSSFQVQLWITSPV